MSVLLPGAIDSDYPYRCAPGVVASCPAQSIELLTHWDTDGKHGNVSEYAATGCLALPPVWDVPRPASWIYVPQPQTLALDFEVRSTQPLVLEGVEERESCRQREYTGWRADDESCWIFNGDRVT